MANEFTGDTAFLHEIDDARQEIFEVEERDGLMCFIFDDEEDEQAFQDWQDNPTREELFDMFCEEGGNNAEPVLNPDGISEEEFEAWLKEYEEWNK